MIEVLGHTEGSEYKAAEKLKKHFLSIWPDLGKNANDKLLFFVGYMVHGGKVEDIDLVVAGNFTDCRTVQFPYKGSFSSFSVKDFVILVEVKEHDPRNIRFTGGIASVKYRNREKWKSVTEQSIKQLHSFKNHLESKRINYSFISNLIYFTQLEHSDLPDDGNFIASTTTIEEILYRAHFQFTTRRGKQPDEIMMDYSQNSGCFDGLRKIMEEIRPTPMDRRKMDLIASGHWRRRWLDDIGKKQIIIRGRAGTGKTVALMQLADHAFRKHNKRSLLITYNTALVADLKRLKGLMGIPDNLLDGGISVSTIHSLIGKLARKIGIDCDERFFERFEDIKNRILNYVSEGLLTHEDAEKYKKSSPESFDFDIVFVDEGQDWPDNEIEILRWFFGLENIVVADGVDQFVRTHQNTASNGWDRGLKPDTYERHSLRKGVRMKNNLALFMFDMAQHIFKLDTWDVDPNDNAFGGRVLILEGDLASRPDIYKKLCEQAQQEGNFPIDIIACVPPAMVNKQESIVGIKYQGAGIKSWNGCSADIRREVLPSKDEFRIVQYESSRGLEGWTVFLFCFDKFWDLKYRNGIDEGRKQGEMFPEDFARRYAGRWMMIPMSRAIDTLVINLSSQESSIKSDLLRISEGHDCIEWQKLS